MNMKVIFLIPHTLLFWPLFKLDVVLRSKSTQPVEGGTVALLNIHSENKNKLMRKQEWH